MLYPLPRLTYDAHGTPGILADSVPAAYFGLGHLHGRHRALQALLLHTLARGRLAEALVPLSGLVSLDAQVRRLDLPGRAAFEAQHLDATVATWLDRYVAGFHLGVCERGRPWELKALCARVGAPDRISILAALMASAYFGLAQCQERMELAIVEALQHGARPDLLEAIFAPHLRGWNPELLQKIPAAAPPGFAGHGMFFAGGSNAWAVGSERTHSGRALFAADPHLQVNQLPALFFEVRARVGNDFWLGATIPGLPGLAIGRNRAVAWSGTFACADNVDWTITTADEQSVAVRDERVRRRFRPALRLRFYSGERGNLMWDGRQRGDVLACRWAGPERAAQALRAYMVLPTARSASEAETILREAHTLSLHYVLADAGGSVQYAQAGRIPRRSQGWSGLYPVAGREGPRWLGYYEGDELPRANAQDGVVASANEARLAADGGVLATLAAPPYRLDRIWELLALRADHDVASMQAMQCDLKSGQAELLRPVFLARLASGSMRNILADWDCRYGAASFGPYAFELAYAAALEALAPELGGDWFRDRLGTSEMRIWWGAGIDRLLAASRTWTAERESRLRAALGRASRSALCAWGEIQTISFNHLVFGTAPSWLRLNRGPFPLPGSRGTIRQAYAVEMDGQRQVTAPAYRFVTDLGDETAWTALPGGIDGSAFSSSYDCWLDDYLAGRYHRLAPPTDDERG